MNNTAIGNKGESLTKEYYLGKGYVLVENNYNFFRAKGRGRVGEIDLLFSKDNLLVIVEVKTRNSEKYGSVFDQVNMKKMELIKKTYLQFIQKNPSYKNFFVRFDFAAVFQNKLTVIENAHTF